MEGRIYTTGEFAKKAGVSVRTIRYYDKQGMLKPSHVSQSGYRLYTDGDFARLQKILTLKYLGFSLEEIREISMKDTDQDYVRRSLELQLGLVRKKMENLHLVEQSLMEASRMIERANEVDWKTVLHLIHLIAMEKGLADQYRTGANTSVRIRLHRDFGRNQEGWFAWLYRLLEFKEEMRLLELGAGNGELWKENLHCLPKTGEILLSDISAGMLQDAGKELEKAAEHLPKEARNRLCLDFDGGALKGSGGQQHGRLRFSSGVVDCHQIPQPDAWFHRVTANHVLFYLRDLDQALAEVRRVLRPGGRFICSTYGEAHMREISELAAGFDERISLSEVPLSDVFGLENGERILRKQFSQVELRRYRDELVVTQAQPMIDYILSCHGNQREYIRGRYDEFKEYIQKKLEKNHAFRITKDAGAFCCR